jgi:hypothetical protein
VSEHQAGSMANIVDIYTGKKQKTQQSTSMFLFPTHHLEVAEMAYILFDFYIILLTLCYYLIVEHITTCSRTEVSFCSIAQYLHPSPPYLPEIQ